MGQNQEPKGFVAIVLEKLKGGEEGKIKRFQKKVTRACSEQYAIREREISDLNDNIADLKEDLSDAYTDLKPENLNNDYVETYMNKIANIKAEIAKKEAKIEEVSEEMKSFKEFQEAIK